MLKLKDILLYMKNLFKMDNVYDCARPILLVLGLFGTGATEICQMEGAKSVENTRLSLFIATLRLVCFTPLYTLVTIIQLFRHHHRSLYISTFQIIDFFIMSLSMFTIDIGNIKTHLHCKDINKILQKINNIDGMLKQEKIQVNYWIITLKVTVFGLVTVSYSQLYIFWMIMFSDSKLDIIALLLTITFISFHLYFIWIILFLLIIQDRFVGLNKLFIQNVRVTNIQIVESKRQHNYLLRCICIARDIHEQLLDVIELFSDTSRFVIIGVLVVPILNILFSLLIALKADKFFALHIFSMLSQFARIVIMIGICQAYKNERRVLFARLRHLLAFETDHRIIQQLKQMILRLYNTNSELVNFQFSEINNELLFAIINVIASNMLVIYSHFRETPLINFKQ